MLYLSSDFEKNSTNRAENISYFKSVQLLCEQFMNPFGLL